MSELGVKVGGELAAWTGEVATQFGATLRASAPGEAEFTVDCQGNSQAAHKLLSELQNRGYVHLADLTAYDEYPKNPRYHVVYELISLKDKKRCAVIAVLSSEKPAVATVTTLWKGADWLEREVYDMYGIVFEQHPDHRRILLPPSFVGHPLRKDFIVDYRQEFAKAASDEGLFDPFGATVVKPTSKEENV